MKDTNGITIGGTFLLHKGTKKQSLPLSKQYKKRCKWCWGNHDKCTSKVVL